MKKRIIPSILLRGGTQVCVSQGFSPWRSVGALVQNLRLHVQREADELLIVNLDKAGSNSFVLPGRLLQLVRQEVDIPIAYSGGIRSAADAAACINAGFDKIYITSGFLDVPDSLCSIANEVGKQSIGLALPYCYRDGKEDAEVWDYRLADTTHRPLQAVIEAGINCGAGELLLHNVFRDGSLAGLDSSLLRELAVLRPSIPVLMAGGAGTPDHVSEVLISPWVNAVVAGSIFALTQFTPIMIRRHCEALGLPMRRCMLVESII